MARYAGKYTPRKSLEQIWNEYRTHNTTDSYGRWPVGYKNQIEHHRIENSPKTANPEYDANNRIIELYNKLKEERSLSEKENNISQLSKNEIDVNRIAQTIAERIESFREFSQQDTPRQLPTIELGEKTFFFDARLWELRNVENPHDSIDLRELEFGSGELPVSEPERKEQKHEIQPDKTSEINTEQNKIETSPKIETHQEPVEKQSESPVEKLGLPISHEFRQADITEHKEPADIRIRRRPGFDPLETGW